MKRKTETIVFFLLIIGLGFYGSVSAEVVDRIVAIVDADIVTQVQLNRGIAPYIEQIENSGYDDEKKKEMIEDVTKKVLNSLIEKSLTEQEAKKYRITISEAELDGAVNNVKENRSLNDEELEAALAKEGMTLEQYRKDLGNQILRARLINHEVKSKVVVSKASIEKYYEENKDKYVGVKKYHIRNILMGNFDKASEIKKMLDENQDFVQLAKTHSIAPNAQDGGDLGLFDISNFPESIKNAIAELEKGDHTQVISTARGFQIFYVQDIVMDGGKTKEQAYDEIHGILYKEQVERKFKGWLESLKKKAHIKIML